MNRYQSSSVLDRAHILIRNINARKCWTAASAPGSPSLEACRAEHLSATAVGAELGATSYDAEVAATSTPHQLSGKYLGATSHGADLLSLETQFILLGVYLLKSFTRRVKK